MTVRVMEWKTPYVWGKAIDIEDKKIINLCLRDENNLIIYDEWDDEIFVDLQLDSDIEATDILPVWITTGRISTANWWEYTGTLLNCKTTSWDEIKLIYTDNWKLYVDNWSWAFKEFLFQWDIDWLRTYIDTELAKKQDKLIAWENITIVEDPQTWELVISSSWGWATYTAGNGIGISNDVISLDNVISDRVSTSTYFPTVTPQYVGQIFRDTSYGKVFIATGTTAADWKPIFDDWPYKIYFKADWSTLQTKTAHKWETPEYTGNTPAKTYPVGYWIFDWFWTIVPATCSMEYEAKFHWSCQWPCPEGYHIPDYSEMRWLIDLIDAIFGGSSWPDLSLVAQHLNMNVNVDQIYWTRDCEASSCWGGGFAYYPYGDYVSDFRMWWFWYIRPIADDQSYNPIECTEVFSNGGLKVLYDGSDLILVGACSYLKIAYADLYWRYQWWNNHSFTTTEEADEGLSFSTQKNVDWYAPSTYSDNHWFRGGGDFRMDTTGYNWDTLWWGANQNP